MCLVNWCVKRTLFCSVVSFVLCLLFSSDAFSGGRVFSFAVYDLDSDKWISRKNEHVPMAPASTMKLVTSVAALDILGPRYRWTTRIYADGTPDKSGRVRKIWIVGSGDPMFLDRDFDNLLKDLYRNNIRKIDTLAIDLNNFNHQFLNTLGDKNRFAAYNVGPFPFIVNYKTTEIDISHQNGNILIGANNYLPYNVTIDNHVKLANIPCSKALIGTYYRPGSSKNSGKILVRGTDSTNCSHHTVYLSFMTHQQYIENLFRRRWQDMTGNYLLKSIIEDVPKKSAILVADHTSYPLSTTLIGMNKFSNNLMSYLTFLSIGYKSDYKQATFAAASKKLTSWVEQENISDQQIRIKDGCGISKNNRLTSSFLSELLRHAFHKEYFPVLLESLPIAGVDGTLAYRFNSSPLRKHAFMKTGTLENVRALAGYWKMPRGHWYSFVALVNCQKKCTDDDLLWLDLQTEKLYLSLADNTNPGRD